MKTKISFILLVTLLVTSCSAMVRQSGDKATRSSSLVDFLYPKQEDKTKHQPEIPVLTLPARVGIAFVPPKYDRRDNINSQTQLALLEKVKEAFIGYDYIEHIEIIPSNYLQSQGGFDSLEQVSRLYDVDLMALVSYDQVTQSMETNAAVLYWTIVGMYVIPGNDNAVQTFVDTAVFDVKSRKMLFRAPGISKSSDRTSAISVDKSLAEQSMQGFELAVADMAKNLDAELDRFKTRVKEEKVAEIQHREGYSGGSLHFSLLALFAALAFRRLRASS